MRAHHSDAETERLAQVDERVGVGYFRGEYLEQLCEVSVDTGDSLFDKTLRFCKEKLLLGEFWELAVPIFLHPIFHLSRDHFMKGEQL